jgi:HAMP domain-containing protein
MAGNLTNQVRGIAQVVTAVANGNLRRKLTVEAKGEIAALSETINNMIDTLATFADQVTTVAREVGVEGKLGGQAAVPGVAGTWKDLTDNVNSMANNLTGQVRNIAEVTTAVARGDLSRKITVDVRGEILQLKEAINEFCQASRSNGHSKFNISPLEIKTLPIRAGDTSTRISASLLFHTENHRLSIYIARKKVC